MLYLLDANVLIDANRDYYPLDRVPQFWDWLIDLGEKNQIKIPIEQYDEITDGTKTDPLVKWCKQENVKNALRFDEQVNPELVGRVINEGYANDLTEDEVESLGKDPFLVAYALVDIENRCVVTTERSRPGRQRANKHVPDVCDTFSIKWCDTFKLTRNLDFRTG